MTKSTVRKFVITLLAALLLLPLAAVRPAQALTCKVNPNTVAINLGYHGATLSVSGENTAGDELIIRIGNAAGETHYKYMGKAGGFFWMKKGNVSFKNVPGVYLLYTSRDIEHLLDPAGQKTNLIGYEALKAATEMETASDELNGNEAKWKEEFIRFKEHQKLYAIRSGTITRQHGAASDTYQAEIAWPYQAPPGTYTVEVMAVRNGQVAERAETSFSVARTGVVAWLSNLAFNSPAVYGIMAVVIAIIAGFAVGMVFRKGGGAH
jgi:uncharacterized protein (TIGR02186 family)